jgi:hypothetical protein
MPLLPSAMRLQVKESNDSKTKIYVWDVPDIKYTYTVIILEKDEYDEIVESDVDDGTDEWIHAFIQNGKFCFPYRPACPPNSTHCEWHDAHSLRTLTATLREPPLHIANGLLCRPAHWSDEIIAAHPGEYMIVIKGSPDRVDVILERYMITGELNRILKLSKVEEDTPTVLLKLIKAMDRNVYFNHCSYKTWETSVGYVAVCDK